MSHSDGEILGLVIRDLKESKTVGSLNKEQLDLINISIEELEIMRTNWGPVLNLFRSGDKYMR
jgi:hypothetical protein